MRLLSVFYVFLSLYCCHSATVFVGRDGAHEVLLRTKRANSGWFEEMKMGNLERECLEEKCSYEEAREVFEHTEATNEFWKIYNVKDHCQSNPCENNGLCMSQNTESYTCLCTPGFSGRNCEHVIKDVPDSCLHDNGHCEHFCVEEGGQRNCSCVDGYFLGSNGQNCLTNEAFPCGKIPLLQGGRAATNLDLRSRIVGGAVCPKGHCPWQVLLKYGEKGFCGGVIYKPTWILTAAHCLEKLKVKFLKIVAVFLDKDDASSVLQRVRRANFFLEEMKGGNLERECIEEICDYEEAREVFEDDTKTKQFWLSYSAKEPCLTNPCKNNGTCVYLANTYYCQCLEGFEGKYCEKGFEETLKCQYVNGGCEQFCDASGPRRTCSCAAGYTLGADGTSCVAQGEYPCGKVPLQNNTVHSQKQTVGGIHCPRGHCPWQALIDYNGLSLCGGALLDDSWVLTAAHCVHQKDMKRLKVITGDHDLDVMDGPEEAYYVAGVVVHENYDHVSLDSDLALLKLNEKLKRSAYTVPVCLPTAQLAQIELAAVRFHTLSGWGKRTAGDNIHPSKGLKAPSSATLQRLAVPLLPTAQCVSSSGVNITANMFCAGYVEGGHESCRGHDGSPLVTRYEGTSFLTGVVSWGKGCDQPGYYGIYTKVANFLKWIEIVMKTEGLNNTGGSPVELSTHN